MKKIFTLLLLTVISTAFAQDVLKFDKKFVQSEDHWVAFTMSKDSTYLFGFIYIDNIAGLTFNLAGHFKIDANGKFIPSLLEKNGNIIHRLKPSNKLVAFIPESKFSELQIEKFPDWLKYYKAGEGTIEHLYKRGYMYNGWEECAKALELLERANKIDPNYKGLRVELAFSYNCLEQFQKATDILKTAVKLEPNDAYIYKELLYSQVHNNQLDDAIITYDKVIKDVTDTTYNAENAFNVLAGYFNQKNLEKFNAWINKTQIDKDKKFGPYVERLKTELEKK